MFLIIEKAIGQQKCEYRSVGKTIKIIITFLLVNFAWIFFRMPSLDDAIDMIDCIFDTSLSHTIYFSGFTDFAFMGLGIVMLFLKDFTDEFLPNRFRVYKNPYTVVRWCAYIMTVVAILLTGVFGADQFIYANLYVMKKFLLKLWIFFLALFVVDRFLGMVFSYMTDNAKGGYIGHHKYLQIR